MRVAWAKGCFEAGADDQAGGGGEGGWVAGVVPVVVTPDYTVDFARVDAAVLEDFGDVFVDGEVPVAVGDALYDSSREVFPVFTDARIKI